MELVGWLQPQPNPYIPHLTLIALTHIRGL